MCVRMFRCAALSPTIYSQAPYTRLNVVQIIEGDLSQRKPGKQGGKHEPDNITTGRAPQGAESGGSSLA